jgi:hypothetical protein
MMTPEQEDNHSLITTESNGLGLVRRMDQRLELVSRLINEIQEIDSLELSEEWCEPNVIEVKLEKNKVFWGAVKIFGDECVIKSQKDGIVSIMLHLSVVTAKKNLNSAEKIIFRKWAKLPNCNCAESLYSEFSFSFVKWLSIPNSFFDQSKSLSMMQGWLNESGDVSWETNEFNDLSDNIFEKVFKSLPM